MNTNTCAAPGTTFDVDCLHDAGKFTLANLPSCLPGLFRARFRAPAAYIAGDVAVVKGRELAVKTIGMEVMPDGVFAQGAVVNCDIDLDQGICFIQGIGAGGNGGGVSGVESVNGLTGPVVSIDLPQFPDVQNALDDKANTSDLANYAPLASPALTGTPTAPTAPVGTKTDQLATTEFVIAAIETAKWQMASGLTNGSYKGKISFHSMPPSSLPSGEYLCDGTRYSLDSYEGKTLKELPDFFKTAWGITETEEGINVPNLFDASGNGYFIRAADGATREVGTKQGDAIRNITGTSASSLSYAGASASGAFKWLTSHTYRTSYQAGAGAYNINFDASRVVPTADENRPINIGMTPAIYLGVERNTYSTDEQLTGETWIDGRPIWRKTYTGTGPSVATTKKAIMTTMAGATSIKITAMISRGGASYPVPFSFGNNYYRVHMDDISGDIEAYAPGFDSSWLNLPLSATVEYVKP